VPQGSSAIQRGQKNAAVHVDLGNAWGIVKLTREKFPRISENQATLSVNADATLDQENIMKTTQILSVLLTVIFVIVRFALLTIAVIRIRPTRQRTKRAGIQRA
jgi:hypothetical protein